MQWFIIWNDTWRWSHSSHLLKINFAKVKPFIKSCLDVVQIPHMAPRTLHTTLHRCYHITWQHYRRMWSEAKINRDVVWFIPRWYILKTDSSYSNSAAYSLCQTLLQMAPMGKWLKKINYSTEKYDEWQEYILASYLGLVSNVMFAICNKVAQNQVNCIVTVGGTNAKKEMKWGAIYFQFMLFPVYSTITIIKLEDLIVLK